jgi:hypothetical protein
MNMKHLVIHILFFFLLSFSISGQDVVINEVQNRNYSTASDEDGDFEDWVEILNASSEVINIGGYGLSDNESDYFKWIFPPMEINPGELIVVWLSGKNRTSSASELHANFSLNSDEYLSLVSPSQSNFDDLSAVYLPKDASYGRSIEMDALVYFENPTIGIPNLSSPSFGLAPPPSLSHSGGFYEDSFQLTISGCSQCIILYTLDGSEPDRKNREAFLYPYKNSYLFSEGDEFGPLLEDSLQSFQYLGPLQVEDRSNEADRISQKSSTQEFTPLYFPNKPSFKGTAVRARAYAQGLLPSETITEVFFVTPEGAERYNLPVVSLFLGEDKLFDYKNGIHTAGESMDTWRLNNPNEFPPPASKGNYSGRGIAWERCAHMDVFDNETGVAFISQDIGIRIHGASSRRFPRKSFRLYAREKYGVDNFTSQLFEGYETDSFERLLLHNSGGDERFTNFRDPMIHRLAKPMEAITNPASPVYVFINGEFYGLNNLREYLDNNYFLNGHGIIEENLDLIRGIDVEYGTGQRYKEVADLCEKGGFESPHEMALFEEMVDIATFRDVFVTNVVSNNSDMLPKNTLWYRNNAATGAENDMFYSILVDQDKGWAHPLASSSSSPAFNSINYYLNDTTAPATPYLRCFQAAMQNIDFETDFLNRTADVLNTFFAPERTLSIIEKIKTEYEPHYTEHIDRWSGYDGNVESLEEWQDLIEEMKSFSITRPDSLRKNIVDLFDTMGLYDLVLDVSDSAHGYIHLNTIDIKSSTEGIDETVYPWKGIYFLDLPINLEAIPLEGFLFSHWEGEISDTLPKITRAFGTDSIFIKAIFIEDTSTTYHPEDELLLKPYPNPNNGNFKLSIQTDSKLKSVYIYDALGREVQMRITKLSAENEWQINTNCHTGVYVLEARFSNGDKKKSRFVVSE